MAGVSVVENLIKYFLKTLTTLFFSLLRDHRTTTCCTTKHLMTGARNTSVERMRPYCTFRVFEFCFIKR